MQSAAELYVDRIQEKGYKMSSCAHSEQWWTQTMRCHACVIENQLCTRVNTIHAFQEANRSLSHNLADFGLQKFSSKSKVCIVSAVRLHGIDCAPVNIKPHPLNRMRWSKVGIRLIS